MAVVPRPCLDCAALTDGGGDRCTKCKRSKERQRTAHRRTQPGDGAQARARRAARANPGEYPCGLCGSLDRVQVDHIKPLVEGGTDYASNIQVLCWTCHRDKTSREAKRRGPVVPWYAPGRHEY